MGRDGQEVVARAGGSLRHPRAAWAENERGALLIGSATVRLISRTTWVVAAQLSIFVKQHGNGCSAQKREPSWRIPQPSSCDGPPSCCVQQRGRPLAFAILRGVELRNVLTDNLGLGVATHPLGTGVPAGNVTSRVSKNMRGHDPID